MLEVPREGEKKIFGKALVVKSKNRTKCAHDYMVKRRYRLHHLSVISLLKKTLKFFELLVLQI